MAMVSAQPWPSCSSIRPSSRPPPAPPPADPILRRRLLAVAASPTIVGSRTTPRGGKRRDPGGLLIDTHQSDAGPHPHEGGGARPESRTWEWRRDPREPRRGSLGSSWEHEADGGARFRQRQRRAAAAMRFGGGAKSLHWEQQRAIAMCAGEHGSLQAP
nr:unnamed protein product [Digitaria exilis]